MPSHPEESSDRKKMSSRGSKGDVCRDVCQEACNIPALEKTEGRRIQRRK